MIRYTLVAISLLGLLAGISIPASASRQLLVDAKGGRGGASLDLRSFKHSNPNAGKEAHVFLTFADAEAGITLTTDSRWTYRYEDASDIGYAGFTRVWGHGKVNGKDGYLFFVTAISAASPVEDQDVILVSIYDRNNLRWLYDSGKRYLEWGYISIP